MVDQQMYEDALYELQCMERGVSTMVSAEDLTDDVKKTFSWLDQNLRHIIVKFVEAGVGIQHKKGE